MACLNLFNFQDCWHGWYRTKPSVGIAVWIMYIFDDNIFECYCDKWRNEGNYFSVISPGIFFYNS